MECYNLVFLFLKFSYCMRMQYFICYPQPLLEQVFIKLIQHPFKMYLKKLSEYVYSYRGIQLIGGVAEQCKKFKNKKCKNKF